MAAHITPAMFQPVIQREQQCSFAVSHASILTFP